MSAYDLAVRAGFKGTLQQWLDSLKTSSGGTGYTPKFRIGGTITLPAGEEATVSLVEIGTDKDNNPIYQLSFGIPKGQDFSFDKLTADDIDDFISLIEEKVVLQSEKGQPGGIPTLDENGKIPASQITASSLGAATTGTVDVAKTIQVTGGPLASALNSAGINTLNKDMSVQELLELLFTDEKYPNPTYKQGSISAIIKAPDISITNAVAEVYSTIDIPTYRMSAINYSVSPMEVGNLQYGYSTDKETKNLTTSISHSIEQISMIGEYSIIRSLNGVETTASANIPTSIASTTLTIQEGTNIIKNIVTGPRVMGNFSQISPVWIYSNLGNLRDDQVTKIMNTQSVQSNIPTDTSQGTIVGVYPMYGTTKDLDTLTKQQLSTSKEHIIKLVSSDYPSKKRHSFAVATDLSISKIELLNTLSGEWTTQTTDKFTLTNQYLKSGNTETLYTVYTRNEYVGESTYKITIL